MCGGARLDPALAEKWEALGVMVLQGYGTTEAAPIIACNSFRYKKLDALGKVLPGQEVRIAPDGEIHTRGPNVTPGYWNQPEITQASFEDEWYKTGDLGYIDEDGFLYFKGRKKDLIVLANGQNVYPEDIEPLLQNLEAVEDAVVVGMPSPNGGEDVHAVLITSDGSEGGSVIAAVNSKIGRPSADQGFQHLAGRGVPPHPHAQSKEEPGAGAPYRRCERANGYRRSTGRSSHGSADSVGTVDRTH